MGIRHRLEKIVGSKAGAWWFLNVAMRIDRVLLPPSRGRLSSAG